jgi:putative heme-binding domain-containing protein
MALRLIPATHPKLTLGLLGQLLHDGDPALRLEAARALDEHPSRQRWPLLLEVSRDSGLDEAVRAQAILGMAEHAQEYREELLQFVRDGSATLRDEALRALINTKLSKEQRTELRELAKNRPEAAALVARVCGEPFATGRPRAEDLDAWLRRLDGPADVAAGGRVFAHPKLAGCYRCHRVDGRGNEVGPDLSTIGRTERRHILESILMPSSLVAPNYQTWFIATADGKVRTGLLARTELDEYTYLDPQGKPFKLNTRSIVETHPLPTSIMPAGLADLMTDQELRDLLAYLGSRR